MPLHFFLLPSLFFLILPLFVAKENLRAVDHIAPTLFMLLAFFAVVSFIILVLLDVVTKKLIKNIYFSEAIEYFFFVIIITGFFLPASLSSGMIDPENAGISKSHVLISLLLASIMMYLSKSKLRKSFYTAIVIFMVVNFMVSVFALYPLISWNFKDLSIYKASNQKNIFVISFDGIPQSAVLEILDFDKELAHKFDGFKFYNQVVSSSPATEASIATSLYGNQNYKEKYHTQEQLWNSETKSLLTNYLHGGGFEVSTYGFYNVNYYEHDRRHQTFGLWGSIELITLINYSIARVLTRHFVIRGDLRVNVEKVIENIVPSSNNVHSDYLRKISSSNGPIFKRRLAKTVLDLQEYTGNLNISSSRPVAHFLHFTHTHFPVDVDRFCKFRGHEKDWFNDNQNRNGVLQQTHCALYQYSEFVEKLKTLNIFDKSLIVLKSDHGKPVKYNGQGGVESLAIRGHEDWGYGRYSPFLAIKNFNSLKQNILYDNRAVMLDDLARTLCVNSGINRDCGIYPGYDILDDNVFIPESAEVTMFIVKSPNSDFRYDTHEPITISRKTGILESLHSTLEYEQPRSN